MLRQTPTLVSALVTISPPQADTGHSLPFVLMIFSFFLSHIISEMAELHTPHTDLDGKQSRPNFSQLIFITIEMLGQPPHKMFRNMLESGFLLCCPLSHIQKVHPSPHFWASPLRVLCTLPWCSPDKVLVCRSGR